MNGGGRARYCAGAGMSGLGASALAAPMYQATTAPVPMIAVSATISSTIRCDREEGALLDSAATGRVPFGIHAWQCNRRAVPATGSRHALQPCQTGLRRFSGA